ncbi:MAG: serine acetyltransferase [Oscillospiraceae bacterium]|nr:serine acetyltransferase [Oscillospiraceae bacterium]
MGTVKAAIFALLHPFLRVYIKLRFGDYWALKEHLQRRPSPLLRQAYEKYFMGYGSYVGVDSKIAGRPYFPHGCVGVFISNDAVIGRDAVIFQQVTIGSNTLPDSKRPGSPVIGDGVYLGAGAKVIGGITVGDCCRVGANAVVVRDLPPHSVAVCAPTQVIQKAGLDNTFRVKIGGVDYVSRNGRLVRETQPE